MLPFEEIPDPCYVARPCVDACGVAGRIVSRDALQGRLPALLGIVQRLLGIFNLAGRLHLGLPSFLPDATELQLGPGIVLAEGRTYFDDSYTHVSCFCLHWLQGESLSHLVCRCRHGIQALEFMLFNGPYTQVSFRC